jgi:hypothetical protein
MDKDQNQEDAMRKHIEEQESKMGNAYAEETIEQPVEEIPEEKVVSLGKVVNREYQTRQSEHEAVVAKFGWQRIAMNNLPSRRKGFDFYPEGTQILIKGAEAPQVRHWSEINEDDPFSIDDAFNDMLATCCKVQREGSDMPMTYRDILEEDRIYVLLEIRKLTYPEPEQNLVFKAPCQHCGYENEMKLENDYFRSVEINDTMKRYYNEETRSFMIRTKSYGEFEIKPPTIGIMQQVSKYIRDVRKMGKTPDMTFIKILPYIAGTYKGLNAKKIKELEVQYISWDEVRFSLMLDLCEKARVGVDTLMYTNCKSCQEEVTAPITFPSGVKALFVISDFTSELL